MFIIRAILRAIILFFDRLFAPKPPVRPLEEQAKLDEQTRKLSIYEFEACPFCVKVRRHVARKGLKIERRDVRKEKRFNRELVEHGGQFQVPCLRIEKDDGSVQWMYESSDIMKYLDQRFPS